MIISHRVNFYGNPSVICFRKCHLPLHKGGFGTAEIFLFFLDFQSISS